MALEPARIRALSWNVHGFVGRSGRRDLEAVARALDALDADVVALQEIDDRRRPPGEPPAFEALPARLGLAAVAVRTLRTSAGDYGHLLLSRWPIAASQALDLSLPGREPRRALSAVLELEHRSVRVLAAHLGLSARERRQQVERIRRHLDSVPETAAIVLGDFNEWRRVGVATRALCPPFQIAASGATYPARRPVFALDRIWCRPPLRPIAARIGRAQRALSDHLPVLAELELGEG